ncbi:MAG: chorismate lyase [Methanobacteriaceae archaeon]|jgi:chorismate-pyruvate lyase|uniref:chorismate lyase n=1 Tax=unclassified Methanobrevibacter TaxID=2638681 RepID=UPI00375C3177|nr:chorismate lyase [Methanobacteriaceae archaeon]MDD4593972.1 chorismate lyase [Methanobacteriaceae archaeon]
MTCEGNNINQRLIEKIYTVEKNYGKTFSNTQKILLTTDGSITAILDVLNGKIDLKTLEQHFEKSTPEIAELIDIDCGEEINYREVLMHKNNKPLIYAISYIPLKRLHDNFKSDLIRADIPIGRILRKYNMESRREIKTIQVEKSNEKLEEIYKTDKDFLTRTYTIIHNEKILIWIKEFFPITYFVEKDSIN